METINLETTLVMYRKTVVLNGSFKNCEFLHYDRRIDRNIMIYHAIRLSIIRYKLGTCQ